MSDEQVQHIAVRKIQHGISTDETDVIAVEEPLEIQVVYGSETGRMTKVIAVTMRTPGDDEALAAGFLFTEGIIRESKWIKSIKYISGDKNRIGVELHNNIKPELSSVARNFYMTSSCGICGKASIDAIITRINFTSDSNNRTIQSDVLFKIRDNIIVHQPLFDTTGGIHASALADNNGKLLFIKEDVGRHNALDKLIGTALLSNVDFPLNSLVLFLSGRSSFELVQKAAMAGINIIIAVGAPSSLAVELAQDSGITLVGFLRDARFNIYSGSHRIIL